jgi:hypothetical protein
MRLYHQSAIRPFLESEMRIELIIEDVADPYRSVWFLRYNLLLVAVPY